MPVDIFLLLGELSIVFVSQFRGALRHGAIVNNNRNTMVSLKPKEKLKKVGEISTAVSEPNRRGTV